MKKNLIKYNEIFTKEERASFRKFKRSLDKTIKMISQLEVDFKNSFGKNDN